MSTFETEYKLENVAATRVPADKIDGTFRSSSIGEFKSWIIMLYPRQFQSVVRHAYQDCSKRDRTKVSM